MSNLGDIQQLYSNLQQIDDLLGKVQVKTETLRTETAHASGELREIEYLFYRVTSLMGRMGLPPEMDRAIMLIQRMVLMVRMLHSAIMLMEMTTPYGLVLGLVSLASAGLTASVIAGRSQEGIRGT